ncbi:MAG: nicotinate phosphoribosyltransferase, partial [Actinomycetes bacterium]
RAEGNDPDAPLVAVAKKSVDKISIGGRKYVLRRLSAAGTAEAELIGIGSAPAGDADDRAVLVPLVQGGQVMGDEPLAAARDRHQRRRAELPMDALKMSRGEPVIETVYLDAATAATGSKGL